MRRKATRPLSIGLAWGGDWRTVIHSKQFGRSHLLVPGMALFLAVDDAKCAGGVFAEGCRSWKSRHVKVEVFVARLKPKATA